MARVELTNTQLNKLKSTTTTTTKKTGTTLRTTKKDFQDEKLSHELLLTTRQKTKLRNAFANNISTGIKLSKTQTSKMIESGGCLGSWLGNSGKKVAVSFTRDNWPGLVSNITWHAINKFERKINKWKKNCENRKGIYYSHFQWRYGWLDGIIKIIKLLEDFGVLIDGITETVKHEIKKQEGEFRGAVLAPLAASFVQPMISSVIKGISGKGFWRVGRGTWMKILSSAPSFKQSRDC